MHALLLAALALAGPPSQGVVVPGESLGGLRLGATPAQVRAAWGKRYGVCRTCARRTWYFTYRPFEPQGAGVEFRNGRVAALFTLWQPPGWRTREGLALGDPATRVDALYGLLPETRCRGYSALRLGRTAFYVRREEVWGFGLLAAGASVCR
ncbi:MAG: hypothetical protein WD689_00055 [Gaiellaceae bacterium]